MNYRTQYTKRIIFLLFVVAVVVVVFSSTKVIWSTLFFLFSPPDNGFLRGGMVDTKFSILSLSHYAHLLMNLYQLQRTTFVWLSTN